MAYLIRLKLFLLLLAVVPAFSAPMYTITGIGGVGGSQSIGSAVRGSQAFAISTTGAVAGTVFDVNGGAHGFVDENASTFYETGSDIRGVNSSGTAVGSRGGQATVDSAILLLLIWRHGGRVTRICATKR